MTKKKRERLTCEIPGVDDRAEPCPGEMTRGRELAEKHERLLSACQAALSYFMDKGGYDCYMVPILSDALKENGKVTEAEAILSRKMRWGDSNTLEASR